MSDERRGMPHDLPEYRPNWPVVIKVKAKVVKGRDGWFWGHKCPRRSPMPVFALGHPQTTHAAAFAAALKHVQGCW